MTVLYQRQEERNLFIEENKTEWEEIGRQLKEKREEHWLPRQFTADQLGISPGRLKRFENGEPVNSSKLIEKCYRLFLLNWELQDDVRKMGKKFQ